VRALSATFHLGRFFGVEVRVFYIALIIMPLVFALELNRAGLEAQALVSLTAVMVLGLYTVIYTHEMSHIAAGWYYRIHTRLITLSPLGGLAHMGSNAPTPRADLMISLAGPAVHLLWLAALAPLYLTNPSWAPSVHWGVTWTVHYLWTLNLMLMVFNLLPFFPMDGGQALAAILSSRMHPNRALVIAARVGMVGAVGIGVWGLLYGGYWAGIGIALGITNFLACRQALVAARHQHSPFGGDVRAPWEEDPEAWRSHGADADEDEQGERSPGWLDRRREQQKRELQEEVDRILARISEVGMDGLTRAEKKTLERASREARGG